jgi:hypothetical protein
MQRRTLLAVASVLVLSITGCAARNTVPPTSSTRPPEDIAEAEALAPGPVAPSGGSSPTALAQSAPMPPSAAKAGPVPSVGDQNGTAPQWSALKKTAGLYADFSLMFQKKAGQYFAGGQVAGQWAWNPLSGNESVISWGNPKDWAHPDSQVRFIHDGDWVLLDGWKDGHTGADYTVRVTQELLCDPNCESCSPIPPNKGRQHYVRWATPTTAYCLKAWGKVTSVSTAISEDFGHTQIYYPPQPCSNSTYGNQTCIKQWESWWDNNNSPGSPIKQKLVKDHFLARGLGPAFTIIDYSHNNWRADLRYDWTW